MCGVCGIDECDDEIWCKVEEEIQEFGSWNIGDDDEDDDEDAAQQVLAPDRASAAQVEVLDDTRPAGEA